MLAGSLIRRMRLDLTVPLQHDDMATLADEDGYSSPTNANNLAPQRWIAIARTLRLTTRPRAPLNSDGSRSRTFARISKSGSMPSWIFNLNIDVDVLSEKLLEESLLPLFKKLHPERSGWNLSLVNVCATNISLTASDGKDGAGRDIGRMFRKQEHVLKDWKIADVDVAPSADEDEAQEQQWREEDLGCRGNPEADSQDLDCDPLGSEDMMRLTQGSAATDDAWDSEDGMRDLGDSCRICGALMPTFAMAAHERFHTMPD